MLLTACRFLHKKVYKLNGIIFVGHQTCLTIIFILACARAHAGQSEHDSECLNKVVIAYISYLIKTSSWTRGSN